MRVIASCSRAESPVLGDDAILSRCLTASRVLDVSGGEAGERDPTGGVTTPRR